MEFYAEELIRRQAMIDKAKQEVKDTVGTLVGLSGAVSASFYQVGHVYLYNSKSGWVLDIEPYKDAAKTTIEDRYIYGVMYLVDGRTVFEYRPATKRYDIDILHIRHVRRRLQGFIDRMKRIPAVQEGLEMVWEATKESGTTSRDGFEKSLRAETELFGRLSSMLKSLVGMVPPGDIDRSSEVVFESLDAYWKVHLDKEQGKVVYIEHRERGFPNTFLTWTTAGMTLSEQDPCEALIESYENFQTLMDGMVARFPSIGQKLKARYGIAGYLEHLQYA